MASLEPHYNPSITNREELAALLLKRAHRRAGLSQHYLGSGGPKHPRSGPERNRLLTAAAVLAIALALVAILTPSAHAQTYSVIYSFSGASKA